MRLITTVLLVAAGQLLDGCVTPPKPSDCQGEFHPVNAIAHTSLAGLSEAQSLALCTGKDGHEKHV